MKRHLFTLVLLVAIALGSAAQQISEAEYFIDSDPGVGNGTAISITPGDTVNPGFTLPTTGLSIGFHNLWVRTKDVNNVWSHYSNAKFYVNDTTNIGLTPPPNPSIVAGEYFVDNDPGVGNGTPISFTAGDTVSETFALPTASLSLGFHNLWVRTVDADGVWSHYSKAAFYVNDTAYVNLTPPPAPALVAAEYFVDTDPGVGNGTAISVTPGDTLIESFGLPTASLSIGFHNLWVRTIDSNGVWSHYSNSKFYVNDTAYVNLTPPPAPTLVAAEYFVDTDPGVGNGTPITITPGDTVIENFSISVWPYALGVHWMFIRTLDAEGTWSISQADSFHVKILPLSIAVTDSTNTSCYTACDGTATATPLGGLPPWSYAWYNSGFTSIGITDSVATGLCAGTYNCVVTDDSLKMDTVSVTITEPGVFIASPNAIDASCGIDDGIAAVSIIGGTLPYTYSWASGDSTPTVDSLASGILGVTVTDNNGCTTNANVFVNSSPAMVVSTITAINPSCGGICDGMAIPQVSSGTPPYSYYWNNASTNDTLMDVCGAVFTVIASDAGGCIDTATVTIVDPAAIIIAVSTINSDCNTTTGTASASVTGGTAPYSYAWSTGDVIATADSLVAGLYTVTVTDAGGCIDFALGTISDNNGPTISVGGLGDVSCNGGADGAINLTVVGGFTPYTYTWSNGSNTEDVSGLSAGPYEISIEDATGCITTQSITITEPLPLSTSFSVFQANCGNSDGVVTSTPSGGTPAYTYNWSSGGSLTTEANLAAGVYSVTVTDLNGCQVTNSVAMSESGGPTVTVALVTESGCGVTTGGIDIDVIGGSTPYTFAWSNSDVTEDLSGVGTGNYTVTVTDVSGCVGLATAVLPSVAPPMESICLVTVDTTTGTNLVAWEKQSTTGLAAYNVYRETSASGVYQLAGSVPIDSLSFFIDTVANPLIRSWRYKITSLDTCGNEADFSSTHKTIHLVLSQFSGNVYLSWDHYDGFSFATYYVWRYTTADGWSKIDSLGNTNSSYTDFAVPGGALDYFIEAKPPSVCVSTKQKNFNSAKSNTSSVGIGNAPLIVNGTSADATLGNCNGTASVTVGGGIPPYTYLWNDPGAQTTETAAGLCAGSFTVLVTDSDGDTITMSYTIVEQGVVVSVSAISTNASMGNCDGTAIAVVSGGIAPYTYLWDDSLNQVTQMALLLCPGTYNVLIIDGNGDSATATVTVVADVVGIVDVSFIESISIYPNPSTGEFVLEMDVPTKQDIQVTITNILGQSVYEKSLQNIKGNFVQQIEIRDNTPGIYNLRLVNGKVNAEGHSSFREITSKKIIVR